MQIAGVSLKSAVMALAMLTLSNGSARAEQTRFGNWIYDSETQTAALLTQQVQGFGTAVLEAKCARNKYGFELSMKFLDAGANMLDADNAVVWKSEGTERVAREDRLRGSAGEGWISDRDISRRANGFTFGLGSTSMLQGMAETEANYRATVLFRFDVYIESKATGDLKKYVFVMIGMHPAIRRLRLSCAMQ